MTNFVELAGIIGSIMLAICGLPQAVQSVKNKSSGGVNSLFLWLWGVGEILMIIYVSKTIKDPILLVNYLLNLIIVGIIAYYKIPKFTK